MWSQEGANLTEGKAPHFVLLDSKLCSLLQAEASHALYQDMMLWKYIWNNTFLNPMGFFLDKYNNAVKNIEILLLTF